MTVSTTNPFRIISSGRPVGVVRATSSDEALALFMLGRDLPAAVELRAYAVSALETRRPRAARAYRAR